MTEATARAITYWLVVLTPVVWIAWDAVAVLCWGYRATISQLFRETYAAHHWFALVLSLAIVGLLYHFFSE